jgi:hypothetical protein
MRSGGKDTAILNETSNSDGGGPAEWNSMLAYLYALAKRASG